MRDNIIQKMKHKKETNKNSKSIFKILKKKEKKKELI